MPINQSPLQVSESYNAASVSEGTAMLLLAVGVIGVLGISRKRKELFQMSPPEVLNVLPFGFGSDEVPVIAFKVLWPGFVFHASLKRQDPR